MVVGLDLIVVGYFLENTILFLGLFHHIVSPFGHLFFSSWYFTSFQFFIVLYLISFHWFISFTLETFAK